MISSGTLHVISTELTVGMFSLSGIAFLFCLIKKGPISREAVAHWALFFGLLATPFAIITGINASSGGELSNPLLANKVLLSMTALGLAIGVLIRRRRGGDIDTTHSVLGLSSVTLMLVTASIGGEYTRRESLLFFLPKETVPIFPMWAIIAIMIVGLFLISKSTIEHRS